MAYMDWTDELSCGVPSIDGQHKILLKMINDIHDVLTEPYVSEKLAVVFSQLITYARNHFDFEEAFFAEYAYAGLDRHKAQHQELRREVGALWDGYGVTPDAMLASEILYLLKDWLSNHIVHDDKTACREILSRFPAVATV